MTAALDLDDDAGRHPQRPPDGGRPQAAPRQAGDPPRRHHAHRRRGVRSGSASTSRPSRRSAPAAGTAGALLALNRPEVLFILGAGQTQGYRRTSLHPLGSLDDHAYVINDAEITRSSSTRSFVERALGLLEKCPGLKQVLTIGPVPEELAHVGNDLVAAAATFDAAAARGRRRSRPTTSRRSPTPAARPASPRASSG